MERHADCAANNVIIPLDDNTDLQLVRLEDAEEFFAVVDRNRDHLHCWLPWAVPEYSMEDGRGFLRMSVTQFRARENFTLMIRHQGKICGAIGLHVIDRPNKSTSLGYWIDEAHQGKGIVSAACRAVVTEGFENFGLHRLEIRCATWNHRSSAIPRRLGFVEEGILRDAQWLHDKWVDLRVFSMLSQDWLK